MGRQRSSLSKEKLDRFMTLFLSIESRGNRNDDSESTLGRQERSEETSLWQAALFLRNLTKSREAWHSPGLISTVKLFDKRVAASRLLPDVLV